MVVKSKQKRKRLEQALYKRQKDTQLYQLLEKLKAQHNIKKTPTRMAKMKETITNLVRL